MNQTCPGPLRWIGIAVFCTATSLGCGDDGVAPATPAQVSAEMEREAEASGNYMMEQSQPKKKARGAPSSKTKAP